MRKKARSKGWDIAKAMPPLRHSVEGTFDITKSVVARWLSRQPGIMQIVFDSVKQHGEICFDPDTGTWRGVDYREICPHGYEDWDMCPDCCH